jgi:HEAT repeat protein
MKKRLFFAFSLILFAVFNGFSQEAEGGPSGLPGELQAYFDLYLNTGDWGQREALLQEVVEEAPASAELFYAAVLQSLFTTYSSVNVYEQNAADSIARITVEKMGEAKYAAAAADINKVLVTIKNPAVRSTAMIALGQLQAKEYLPRVIQILEDANNQPVSQNRQPFEQLAFGAIVALEYFQDEAAYLPVYFAARGWYNEQVKDHARQTLPKISAEPWDLLISIIKGPRYSIENKRDALQTLDESSAEDGKKSEAAGIALAQSWATAINDGFDRENIKEFRKDAIGLLGKYGTEDDSAYKLIEKAYIQGDVFEKRAVISALSEMADSQAVAMLSRFLQAMNVKLTDNTLTNSDRAMTRTLIGAIGKTGSSEAKPALNAVLSYNWPNAVKDIARTNLQKIP